MSTRHTIAATVQRAIEILSRGDCRELESGEYLCVEYAKGVELSPIYPDNVERTGGALINVFWDGQVFLTPTPFDGVADASGGKELSETTIEIDFSTTPPTWREVDDAHL